MKLLASKELGNLLATAIEATKEGCTVDEAFGDILDYIDRLEKEIKNFEKVLEFVSAQHKNYKERHVANT